MFKLSIIFAVAAIYMFYTRDTFRPGDVLNKNVLVTGSSKGIGRALAIEYAKLGANVMVTARNEKALKEVVEECRRVGRKGAKFGYVVADMLQYEKTSDKLIKETIDLLGSIDHVILNHALLPQTIGDSVKWDGSMEKFKSLQDSMEINFMSYVYLTGALLPYLKESKGSRFGVISSLAGKVPLYGEGTYCATKFAIDGFFSSLRIELSGSEDPIPVTVCNLGYIETEDTKHRLEKRAKALGVDPLDLKAKRPSSANVKDTAIEVIKATTRGDRELYFPFYTYGINTWWAPVFRHVWPAFVESNPENIKKL